MLKTPSFPYEPMEGACLQVFFTAAVVEPGFAIAITHQSASMLTAVHTCTSGIYIAVNIGEHIRYLSAFMKLRDTNPVFDRMKEIGDVGVPAFVFEDGRVSIDPADAGLIEYGSQNACSVEDHKNGRKGC